MFKRSMQKRTWIDFIYRIKALISSRWKVYLFAVLCVYLSLSQLAHCIDVFYESSFHLHLRRWLDAFLLAFPLLWMRRKIGVFVWFGLVNIYLLTIIWYFRTYATIMPLHSYLMVENTDGLISYIFGSLAWQDVGILLPFIIFLSMYVIKFQQLMHPISTYAKLLIIVLLVGLVSLPYWPNSRPAWMQPSSMFNIVGPRAFKEFGVANFWIYQIGQTRPVSKEEQKMAIQFMNKLQKKEISQFDLPYPKNLIIILVESLQSWTLGLQHHGVEVTPVMNRLLKEEHTVYFPHVVSQVKDGRSSDAQLIINTGLLPLNTRAAASLCSDNTFPSLAKALESKGYESVSFICDEKDFWNQGRTTVAYGFHQLYDRLQQGKDKEDADSLLFYNTKKLLNKIKEPFYAQIVTYSTHMPYDRVQYPYSALARQDDLNEDLRNYLIAIQLFDQRLGKFLQYLKDEGLYDRSVIVLIGDHEQMPYHLYEGRKECKVSDCTVPFMILNCPLTTKHTNKVVGQVDIYPSLLHIMGCQDYIFPGLGETLFGDSISNVAHYRTGEEWVSDGTEVSQTVKLYRKNLWTISDILLRMNYFTQQ